MRFVPRSVLLFVLVVGLTATLAGGYFLARTLIDRRREAFVEIKVEEVAQASPVAQQFGVVKADREKVESGNNLTILFYYDGYADQSLALRHIGLLQGALKNVEPFKSSKNLHTRVITSGSEKCKVEQGPQKILRCDKSLIEDINKLNIKHFKLVVLSPKDFVPNARQARGKNSTIYLPAFKGVLTDDELNVFLARFFLHELGHSLGLRDEYKFDRNDNVSPERVSDNIAYQAAQPNCAPDKETAQKWWKEYETAGLITYENGCAGMERYVYPQKTTLMSVEPEPEAYGVVSEDYLRGTLACFYGADTAYERALKGGSDKPLLGICDSFKKQYPNFWNE